LSQIERFKLELEKAIEVEDFENAAVLRDQILSLENQIGELSGIEN